MGISGAGLKAKGSGGIGEVAGMCVWVCVKFKGGCVRELVGGRCGY